MIAADEARPEKLCYDVPAFMAAANHSRNATYKAINAGLLRSFRIGMRRYISVEAAKEYIAKLEQGKTSPAPVPMSDAAKLKLRERRASAKQGSA